MRTSDFTSRDKLGCLAASLLFWLVVPLAFWLLSSGFGGGLFVPDFGLIRDGDFPVSFVFSFLFYFPLLAIAFFAWSAVAGRPTLNVDDEHASN